VIGGYTIPEGNRKYFGSLLVGYQSPADLRFAGRVGTGFSEKLLTSVDAQLQKLKRSTCPFINLPEKTRGRWGLGITPAIMNAATGLNLYWSLRSSLPSGRMMASSVSRCSWGCEPTNSQKKSFVKPVRRETPGRNRE
jgi:ATP dependent DNA ligase-like protein